MLRRMVQGVMDPKRKKTLKRVGLGAIILLGIYGGLTQYVEATDTWVPRPLWYGEQVQSKKQSPDGRFEAEVVYLDGLTYGIQFVRLRNRRSWIPFAKKIAVANLEEVTDIEWKSPTELCIKAVPDDFSKAKAADNFELCDTSCYGITITYNMIKEPLK